MATERIYVLGATGNVGSNVVHELTKSGAQVTAYTRSPQKIQNANVSIIKGGCDDLTPFKESIAGHTRLFLVVPDGASENMAETKTDLCRIAYDAGVKQVVDLSVQSTPWRHFAFLLPHQEAEHAIFKLKRPKNSYVSLRPSNFMTNLFFSLDTIKRQSAIIEVAGPNERQEWISPRDIGTIAAKILLEPVEKHGDAGYELVGDIVTPTERADIFTKVLGRPVTYSQVPVQEYYDRLVKSGIKHAMAYCIVTYQVTSPAVTRGLPVLLGRSSESIETWIVNNKEAFA